MRMPPQVRRRSLDATLVVAIVSAVAACSSRPPSSGTMPAVATVDAAADSAKMARVLAGLNGGLDFTDRPLVRWTLA